MHNYFIISTRISVWFVGRQLLELGGNNAIIGKSFKKLIIIINHNNES